MRESEFLCVCVRVCVCVREEEGGGSRRNRKVVEGEDAAREVLP